MGREEAALQALPDPPAPAADSGRRSWRAGRAAAGGTDLPRARHTGTLRPHLFKAQTRSRIIHRHSGDLPTFHLWKGAEPGFDPGPLQVQSYDVCTLLPSWAGKLQIGTAQRLLS